MRFINKSQLHLTKIHEIVMQSKQQVCALLAWVIKSHLLSWCVGELERMS